MKKSGFFPVLFSVVMLVFIVFMVWYVPSVSSLSFRLQDAEKSLETSQGRERKQQYEYDKAVEDIGRLQSELDDLLPQAEAAEEEYAVLKKERNKLRKEKRNLLKQQDGTQAEEVSGDEQ